MSLPFSVITLETSERGVEDGGLDAVQPNALVVLSGDGEGGSGELLRVKIEGALGRGGIRITAAYRSGR